MHFIVYRRRKTAKFHVNIAERKLRISAFGDQNIISRCQLRLELPIFILVLTVSAYIIPHLLKSLFTEFMHSEIQ